jgi:hypothetical protein
VQQAANIDIFPLLYKISIIVQNCTNQIAQFLQGGFYGRTYHAQKGVEKGSPKNAERKEGRKEKQEKNPKLKYLIPAYRPKRKTESSVAWEFVALRA